MHSKGFDSTDFNKKVRAIFKRSKLPGEVDVGNGKKRAVFLCYPTKNADTASTGVPVRPHVPVNDAVTDSLSLYFCASIIPQPFNHIG